MFSVMCRFRAKNGDWVWLRNQAYAFLNPYNDEVEYIVCTNSSSAKWVDCKLTSLWSSINYLNFQNTSQHCAGQWSIRTWPICLSSASTRIRLHYAESSWNSTLQSSRYFQVFVLSSFMLIIFNALGLMSHIAVPQQQTPQPQAPNSIQQRPNSAQNSVQYNYEPTPSPIQ